MLQASSNWPAWALSSQAWMFSPAGQVALQGGELADFTKAHGKNWAEGFHGICNLDKETIDDFVELCEDVGITIEQGMVLDARGQPRALRAPGFLANLLGEQGLFVLPPRR